MRQVIFSICIAICPLAVFSQGSGLYMFLRDGKSGYMDRSGKEVIAPQFQMGDIFLKGRPVQEKETICFLHYMASSMKRAHG